ncbi:phosphatase PAP2 family protein [Secundilactobacillus oryzae]|uniref:phosphatase PAP2 family protein n=1 Tax=Secundilactobacillus oryzae TaxID=1202668 RepID=UPI00054FC711|nr:phosphatase PAP2 family protein [Secundilactobacillus oryzae]
MKSSQTLTNWQVKRTQLGLSVIALLGFIILLISVLTGKPWLTSFDQSLINFFRGATFQDFRGFLTFVTLSGNPVPVGIFTFILAIISSFLKNYKFAAFLLINVLSFGGLANSLIKNAVQRPRPDQHPLFHLTSYSFPSGHSITAMLLFGSLILMLWHLVKNQTIRVGLVALLAIWIALIGISRIYVGVHYPSDVLAGFLLGFVLLTLSQAFFYGIKWR